MVDWSTYKPWEKGVRFISERHEKARRKRARKRGRRAARQKWNRETAGL